MEYLSLVHRGTEEFAASEISMITDIPASDIKEENMAISFSTEDNAKAADVVCRSQTSRRMLGLLGRFDVHDDLDSTILGIKELDIDLYSWISKGQKLRIECERHGEHGFRSVDISSAVAGLVKGKIDSIDFNSYDVTLFIFICDKAGFIGLDLTGFDASKRSYKIFQTRDSLKGTLVASFLIFSGYSPKKVFVDPFGREGIITIEAALMAEVKAVHHYDKEKLTITRLKPFATIDIEKALATKNKGSEIHYLDSMLRNMNFAQKNSKIAGVNDSIDFSKKDLSWLDMKFEQSSVDLIAGYAPEAGRSRSFGQANRIYSELFHQASFLLKAKGELCVIQRDPGNIIKAASNHKFKKDRSTQVFSGKQQYEFISFRKVI